MSKDTTDPKALASLLKKLKAKDAPSPRTPIEQLVLSFLNWETSRRQAEQAFDRLMQQMVDINDVRVSLDSELIRVIGEDYPLVMQRVIRMREALNEVYRREHDVNMATIASKGKKEQRAYLETLPGTPAYVVSQVFLLAFGGHGMPVDQKLVALLAREAVVDAEMSPEDVESFLLRNIKADEALDAHLKLQGWADESRLTPTVPGPVPGKLGDPDATRPKPPRKVTKKTTKLSKKK